MNLGVVIPAAGEGSRMGENLNKQYLKIAGKPVLLHTVLAFNAIEDIKQMVIVVKEDELEYCRKAVLSKLKGLTYPVELVIGGATRKESVYSGLLNMDEQVEHVIIHDGARPLVSKHLIERVIAALEEDDAVTCGVKVKDTIKLAKDNYVEQTLARDSLVAVQTPQAFKYDLILRAHQAYQQEGALDDASLVEELADQPVRIVRGNYHNLKLTTPEDLPFAEYILKEYENNV